MQAVFLGMLYTSVFKLTLLRSFGSYNGMLRTTPIKKKKKMFLFNFHTTANIWVDSVFWIGVTTIVRMLRTKNKWSSSKDDILRSCFSEDSSDNTFSSLSYFAKEEGGGEKGEGKVGSRVLYDPRGPGGNKAIASLPPARLSLLTPHDKAN